MALQIRLLKVAGATFAGNPRYISPSVFFDDFDKVTIGERTVISSHVSLLTHDYSLTTVMRAVGQPPDSDMATVRPIKIGNNVFVGRSALLMPGTSIGDDSIVGAGAVVRGTIPARSIVIGNPAEVIGSIDDHYASLESRLQTMQLRKDPSLPSLRKREQKV